ncbi:MAG: N-acetylmuramoyl-L-alanine amidase [Marinoscillum sp.]|uniref:N-acetylmuramoyl-L-alanine amidase n=1 Tax=Marinoscillum sp. TaxID=2024838 RepID=UPI0032F24919
MHRKLAILLLFFLQYFSLPAQKNPSSQELGAFRYTHENGKVLAGQHTTALVLKSTYFQGSSVQVEVNGLTRTMPLDPDAPEYTYFLSLPDPIQVTSVIAHPDFTIFLINSGKAPVTSDGKLRSNQEECDFSVTPILQVEWRNGLNPPSYSRSFTDVEHVIVHHAAGSNTNTNYTQVVRDIYIYHTEVNGWSDIGYNYLIAQNGALYAGRDPAGGAQDNVLGAHFCGSNSRTMGVCLLGNYETASPTGATWSTLQELAAFKLQKENLDAFGSTGHPLGQIDHIAGHRDGCSTLCPGGNVYDRLSTLRTGVDDLLTSCEVALDFEVSDLTLEAGESLLVTNTSHGYDRYSWIFDGGNPPTAEWPDGGEVHYNYGGIFDITLIGHKGESDDTLSFPNAIRVLDEPRIFPNPAKPLTTLNVSTSGAVIAVEILGLQGRTHYSSDEVENGIPLPYLSAGVYVVRIQADGRWTSQMLLVQ